MLDTHEPVPAALRDVGWVPLHRRRKPVRAKAGRSWSGHSLETLPPFSNKNRVARNHPDLLRMYGFRTPYLSGVAVAATEQR
jgi:hypothetical protein